jgi:DNA-binding transcriptional MerR regulator
MAEYRIDELAQAAGMTVRNVRVYQDRGLLPPPRREGRVGIYSESHLARLRLIGGLLDRGYGFTHIAELIQAWERGHDVADLLGLEQVLTSPWTDEIAGYVTAEELLEMYGAESTPETIARGVELGLLEQDGDRFRVPSPRLLHAGAELVAAGIPLATVLDLAATVRTDIEHTAQAFVEAVNRHVIAVHGDDWLPSADDVPELAALIARLRPLAQMAVDASLALAMERQVRAVLGDRFVTLADRDAGQGEVAGTAS